MRPSQLPPAGSQVKLPVFAWKSTLYAPIWDEERTARNWAVAPIYDTGAANSFPLRDHRIVDVGGAGAVHFGIELPGLTERAQQGLAGYAGIFQRLEYCGSR